MRYAASALALASAALLMPLVPARAQQAPQQSPQWFVPGQQQQKAPPRTNPHATPQAAPTPGPEAAQTPQPAGPPPPQMQLQLPPVPQLPPLPKGSAPPAAVIGVLGVPEVMRASTAAQEVERTIGGRRAKLNQDAQKEQAAWRDMQQALVNDRAKLKPDQIRARERALQDRITTAQRQFRDRNRIIQEEGQYALGQIEQTLIAVIRQVSESRGMNLVLHRQQVALNVNEFDITAQVADELNKILPHVIIPAEGQEPPMVPVKPPGAPAAAGATPPAGTPAAATPTAGAPAAGTTSANAPPTPTPSAGAPAPAVSVTTAPPAASPPAAGDK
ncbi:OmpH family outer membrane protein [Acidibrevibacterium fodinaquatile]|uniref:OmpH family outer membrane protein n=1 Tax=Acidibrevibacterium fodinaquatile TaxID=1969806 RepID=UPI001F085FE5|nr:OmpH family outer membrane protein [Acidibrevibacterium fodinaquatile]